MSNTRASSQPPHIAVFPSAGMGHLTPSLRIASMLLSRGCIVTLITARPTVSLAESDHISSFLSEHPQVKHIEFQAVTPKQSRNANSDDPFFVQFHAISQSGRVLLCPLLSCVSPPLSAVFSDIVLTSSTVPIASELGIPFYVICTSSVKFFCFAAYLPVLLDNPTKLGSGSGEVEIPGLGSLSVSNLPPPVKDPNHLLTSILTINARLFSGAKGILVNTFDWFESETIEAVNSGRVLESLPKVLPIGPLEICEPKKEHEKRKEKENYMSWLDEQPMESVVYVSFGSRTAMSREQIRELSKGLERSGHRFLWVVKTSKVDKEDKEEHRDLLGESFLERTKDKGLIVKGWVSQKEILDHPAIGAFVSHCGWNSVSEAAQSGVPMLAWPQHGDQKLNAEVVESAGLGLWERDWGWGAQVLVGGDEIGKKITEAMEDEKLREMARKVGYEAKKAVGPGGSSDKMITEVLEFLQHKTD